MTTVQKSQHVVIKRLYSHADSVHSVPLHRLYKAWSDIIGVYLNGYFCIGAYVKQVLNSVEQPADVAFAEG